MYSLYVDDFIVLCLENEAFPETVGDAVKLRNLMKEALIKAGFSVHKEAEGFSIAVTGVIGGGEDVEAAPAPHGQRHGRPQVALDGHVACGEGVRAGSSTSRPSIGFHPGPGL